MKIIQGALVVILSCVVIAVAHGQNTIQFNAVNVTEEGAIRLSWVSNSNEVYQVQCADTLIDTNTGLTPWQVLYDQYPSHGTNTFLLDTGNYRLTPNIVHPKYSPMRFYRILSEGTNNGETPFVAITSPTNGSVLSDQVTISVTATSSYPPSVGMKLYVDGELMPPTKDGTNFVINTCEWPNGPHTLFATAFAQSRLSGPRGLPPLLIGQAVSGYVQVSFSNLITKVAFSQAFFQPSLGQTQEVTATFGANVDWTLHIVDDSSNAVRTVTGSGGSLIYDWDGTGDGGTNIPDGVYYYQISATTNGLSLPSGDSGSDSTNTSPPPPSPGAMQMYAIPSGSADAFPLAIYPPGMDTNGMTLFEASPLEMSALEELLSFGGAVTEDSGVASPDFAGPDAQATTAPTRPPTAPVKNQVNNYAIGYYEFPPNIFPSGRTIALPKTPTFTTIHLDGDTATVNPATLDYIPTGNQIESAIFAFEQHGWQLVTNKGNSNLSVQDMRRSDQSYFGGEYFTHATIGIFFDHGAYGTDPDSSHGASNSKQTYFPSGNPADNGVNEFDNGWLRMCQIGFGGDLKWMVINACNALCDPNYSSMESVGAIPLKTTHLLCSVSTVVVNSDGIEGIWVDDMLDNDNLTVASAWILAGREAYRAQNDGNTNQVIKFRITGYPECMFDTIKTNTAPTSPSPNPRNLTSLEGQVYPQ